MDFIFELLGWILLVYVGGWIFFQILIGFKDLGLIILNKLKFFKYFPKFDFKNELTNDPIFRAIENSTKIESPSNLNEDHSFTGTKTIVFSNGGSYEGDFINGKRTGKGFEIWPNGDTYKGDYVDGKRTGKGIFKLAHGETYEGDFVDGKITGKGIYNFINGGTYKGDLVESKRFGKGFETYPDGGTYKGEYVDGKKSIGVNTWKNGNIYDGGFHNNQMSGKGIFKWASGETYEGDFVDGNKTGKGIYTWKNGNIYEGEIVDDKITGKGLFKWVSGAIYEGQFKDNVFVEFGKSIDNNGNIDGGKWEYNSLDRKKNKNSSKKKVVSKEQMFEINRVYRKSQIYKIFNVPRVQQGGKWRNGYCEHNNEFFIFANIGIPGKTDAGEYDYKNKINDNDEMEWEAQNGSKLSWPTVQKLKKSNPYIFVRYKDFRSGIYKFIGVGDCMETKDTSPVYFKWRICDYKESNDNTKKNEFIEVISAVNQFKKIKDKEGKKPIEKATEKILPTNNIAQEKTKLLDKDLLKEIFNDSVKKTFNIYKREENPFKIKYIHSKTLKISYWVFLKNISPAHLSNLDISRIQIENKPVFKEIDEKKELCIPIGYDSINKVFVVWNPDLFLKRILNKRNISIYSRFSDQTNLTENFKEFELTNDEKVFIVNSNFISVFLKNIKTYFKINNNISESSTKQSNTSLLPSSQKSLFKYLSDVDNLLKSGEVLKAVQIIYERHKDNKDFKNYEFKDWFDLITVYKNHKF